MSIPHRTPAADSAAHPRHCAYCGSSRTRPSRKDALLRFVMRLVGARVVRCDACGRRFAFRPLSRRNGRHPEGD